MIFFKKHPDVFHAVQTTCKKEKSGGWPLGQAVKFKLSASKVQGLPGWIDQMGWHGKIPKFVTGRKVRKRSQNFRFS